MRAPNMALQRARRCSCARYGLTTTFPVISARWTVQKYGKLPAVGKVCEKLPLDFVPESHFPSAVQHVPDVVEWVPLTHVHMMVSPARIVVVLLPL